MLAAPALSAGGWTARTLALHAVTVDHRVFTNFLALVNSLCTGPGRRGTSAHHVQALPTMPSNPAQHVQRSCSRAILAHVAQRMSCHHPDGSRVTVTTCADEPCPRGALAVQGEPPILFYPRASIGFVLSDGFFGIVFSFP